MGEFKAKTNSSKPFVKLVIIGVLILFVPCTYCMVSREQYLRQYDVLFLIVLCLYTIALPVVISLLSPPVKSTDTESKSNAYDTYVPEIIVTAAVFFVLLGIGTYSCFTHIPLEIDNPVNDYAIASIWKGSTFFFYSCIIFSVVKSALLIAKIAKGTNSMWKSYIDVAFIHSACYLSRSVTGSLVFFFVRGIPLCVAILVFGALGSIISYYRATHRK